MVYPILVLVMLVVCVPTLLLDVVINCCTLLRNTICCNDATINMKPQLTSMTAGIIHKYLVTSCSNGCVARGSVECIGMISWGVVSSVRICVNPGLMFIEYLVVNIIKNIIIIPVARALAQLTRAWEDAIGPMSHEQKLSAISVLMTLAIVLICSALLLWLKIVVVWWYQLQTGIERRWFTELIGF